MRRFSQDLKRRIQHREFPWGETFSSIEAKKKLTKPEKEIITNTFASCEHINGRIIRKAFEALFDKHPNLSVRDLAKYSARIIEYSQTGVGNQRIEEFTDSIRGKKKRKTPLWITSTIRMYLRRGKIRRPLSLSALEAWQKLERAGVPVEKIVKARKIKDGVIVESEVSGETIEDVWSTLTKGEKSNIHRQCLSIIRKTWQNGVVHGHMHPGNFRVVFEEGIPKVRLVDFKYAKTFDVNKLKSKQDFFDLVNGLRDMSHYDSPSGFAVRTIVKTQPRTKEESRIIEEGLEFMIDDILYKKAKATLFKNLQIGKIKF